jgi:hypothetical protein
MPTEAMGRGQTHLMFAFGLIAESLGVRISVLACPTSANPNGANTFRFD